MPRKKAVSEPAEAEPEQVEAGTMPEPEEVPPQQDPTPEPRRRRPVSEDILSLSDTEVGITSEDTEDAKWGYLAGAAKRKQVLTGIVSNVVPSPSGNDACAVDFEGMRVLIPFREMTFREWPPDETTPRSVTSFMKRLLGATVDFVPVAVDIRNRAAVGSRKEAMLARQKQYYQSGRVQPGILMACRVIEVGSNTMTVEACGVDTEIPARNVSWEWFSDIADLFSVGDLAVARVMDVDCDENGRYSVDVSIKAATEHRDRAAFEKLIPNSNYFGVVTGVTNGAFFVRLQSGVNAKTRIYRSSERPSRRDTVCFRVTRLDEEKLIAKGFITRIIKRHSRLR